MLQSPLGLKKELERKQHVNSLDESCLPLIRRRRKCSSSAESNGALLAAMYCAKVITKPMKSAVESMKFNTAVAFGAGLVITASPSLEGIPVLQAQATVSYGLANMDAAAS